MNVLMMPDYRADNPYQELLAQSLATAGCEVRFPTGYRRVLPLWRAARDEPPASIVHLHWTTPYVRHAGPILGWVYSLKLLFDVWMLKRAGRHLVWTLHNLLPHDHPSPVRERWLRRMLCRQADQVIVHSENGRQEAMAQLGCNEQRMVCIPHGHYRSVYGISLPRAEARNRLNLPAAQRVFLFFGLLRPYKGLERLLRAWSEVMSAFPVEAAAATLLVVGEFLDDAYRKQIEEVVAKSPHTLLIEGRVPDEQVATYFSAADVGVLPFERIQTSGTVLLAMSFGLPVIAPRLGDVPETLAGVEDLLFDPAEEESLQKQISHALQLDETDLFQLRQRTEQACSRFDWNSIGQQTAALYERVLGQEHAQLAR